MNLGFLPIDIFNSINQLNVDKLTEIRIREGYPIIVGYLNNRIYLKNDNNSNIIATKNHIERIIDNVTERSIYAFNNCIKEGYITTNDGIRIGLSGKCVFEKENIITINNFSSLNIRIPHLVNGCSDKIFQYIYYKSNLVNALIVSPPAMGKTTILKDLALKLNKFKAGNILIIDERNEFSLVSGECIDKIVYSDKNFAFNYALRSLSPEIVITDELTNKLDWEFVRSAISSGIKILASCHADNIIDLKSKQNFISNLFDRYIFLKKGQTPGVLDCVYDGGFGLL